MPFSIAFISNCAALGVCLFAISSAVLQTPAKPSVGWLIAFFVAHILGLSVALAQQLDGANYPVVVLIALPALLVYSPSLFFYVHGLTGSPPASKRQRLQHFAPALILLAVSLFLLLAPAESRSWIGAQSEKPMTGLAWAAKLTLLGAMLGFIAQALFYAWRIYQHLAEHRERLKDAFASTEQKELGWASVVSALLVVYAIQTAIPVLAEPLLGWNISLSKLDAGLSLALIWTLGLWGLRQTPVAQASETKETPEPERYSKSTLPTEAMERIARKIEETVKTERRYADPNFSLSELADATGVSSNHLSQTLNTQIGERFFDYINHHRIAAAQDKLKNSEDGISEILYEVGFNSRSAFYRAFKRETGASPAQWRKDRER